MRWSRGAGPGPRADAQQQGQSRRFWLLREPGLKSGAAASKGISSRCCVPSAAAGREPRRHRTKPQRQRPDQGSVNPAPRAEAGLCSLTTSFPKLVLSPGPRLRCCTHGSGARRSVRKTGDAVSSVQRTPGKVSSLCPVVPSFISRMSPSCPALVTHGRTSRNGSPALQVPRPDLGPRI